MFFEAWDLSKFKIYEWRSVGLKSNSCAVHAKKVHTIFVKSFSRGREIIPGGENSPPWQCRKGGGILPLRRFPPHQKEQRWEGFLPPLLKSKLKSPFFLSSRWQLWWHFQLLCTLLLNRPLCLGFIRCRHIQLYISLVGGLTSQS